MNANINTFEIYCEARQAYDVVSSLLHTILFHRAFGKFNYSQDTSYSIGTLGYEDIKCECIDLTYVRCASPPFTSCVNQKLREFSSKLNEESTKIGSIFLEFYSKKRGHSWSLTSDSSTFSWEIWTIRLDCLNSCSSNVHNTPLVGATASPTVPAYNLEEVLLDKVLSIINIVNNKRTYLPAMPTEKFLANVFDTSYPDVQPYLHKIHYRMENPYSATSPVSSDRSPVATDFKKFMDTILKL